MPKNTPKKKQTFRIYLIAGRKQWYHELPRGWKEVAWERFDYVECGIFEKSVVRLNKRDKELVESYGEEPEGWIEPS